MKSPRACHATLKFAELTESLEALVARYPHLLELTALGRSPEGREIWAVTAGDRRVDGRIDPDAPSPTATRPALYVDANIHAAELTGSTACLALLHALCDGSATPEGEALLRRVTFYVVPRVSPDGAEHVLTTGEYLRSSPLLYPHEDLPEGLHPRDLDDDGIVCQMRIEDPAGGWRASASDPRVMVRRTVADREGPFYRLYPEGLLHGFDGHVLKEAPRARGLDFNRNFPQAWKPEQDQRGAGPFPLSAPETRAIAEFVRTHRNIAFFLALHTGIEVLIPPEGARAYADFPAEDRALFQQLGAPGAEMLSMPLESLFPVDYGEIHGDFGEWLYDQHGIPGFVAELWSPAARAGISLKDQIQASRGFTSAEPMDLAIAAWLDSQGIDDQLRPWHPFDHPQLGRLELGGWRQGLFSRAPDGPLLEQIGEQVAGYAMLLARALPQLELRALDLEPLGSDLYRLGVTVVNGGLLPTQLTRMAIQREVAREVEARLELPAGVERLVGPLKQRLGHLEGFGGMARAEWLVRGPVGSELTIRIESWKGGRLERRVRLGS